MRSILACLLGLLALAARADEALIGIWSCRTAFGAPLHGSLTVERTAGAWHAAIGDAATSFRPQGDDIRFAFADDRGRFRGRLGKDGAIRGFWIRPGVTSDPRFPGGSSQPFATPAVLVPAGQDEWQGTVRPLPDPFTLHLSIHRNAAGTLLAAFRNPEQNARGPAMQYRVQRTGDTVRFIIGADPQPEERSLEARYLAAPERIRIHWEALGREIELVRDQDAEASTFHPRLRGRAPYRYAPPAATADGWAVARAGDLGLDEAALERMVQAIIDGDPAARRPSLIHSIVIAYQGKLVLDEYFFGHDRDQVHDIRSAGKTFSSVLLGAVMRDGVAVGPDTRVYELMRDRGPFANPDPRKSAITLAHLMTHTSGLACDDYDDASPGNEGVMQTQTTQPDWWKYTLNLPMAHEPGTRYAYCAAISLMGGALTTATGTWLPELFARYIARPLQFGEWHWNLLPNDEGYLSGGAFLRPRDLLKIGQAYLDGGAWNGRRIVDADWVRESTAPRVAITPATTGLDAEAFQEAYFEGADALAWHIHPIRSGERVYDAYAATGNGGQLLIVIPELAMTAVFTGGNYLQGGIWFRWPVEYLGGHVIPAVRRKPSPASGPSP